MARGLPAEHSVGKRFGKLVVISVRWRGKIGAMATVRCDCGTTKEMQLAVVRRPSTISCGCFNRTKFVVHGESKKTKEYQAWANIKTRTTNKKLPFYDRYGGRGITMCKRWSVSFLTFLKDVGRAPSPKHTIERIDNNRGYEPGNVRWATQLDQTRNTRRNILNPFLAIRIRELRSEGMMLSAIRDFLRIPQHCIEYVLYQGGWRLA